ncbi:hypothetical protein [Methylobacterium tarhaniae]|uniref:hypothetical protein n=1 Tax=Methylobacterium tarhaniae TaxID=1187852 RepID=UPI0012EE845E|nr:hypothetical protein [Methylobacterium tarhaniae]
MLLMLPLDELEVHQERLGVGSRQTMAPQTMDEGTLIRDVARAVLNVPPDHVEFGFTFSHQVRIANVLRPGSIPRPRLREMLLCPSGASGRRRPGGVSDVA